VITTLLHMTERPHLAVTPPHRSGMLLRLDEPTAAFYRFLYETVGRRWGWSDRDDLSDEELLEIVADPAVIIFVLFMGGVPAGFFELDCRTEGEVELAHFGLMPEFIGRGLGKYLLAAAIDVAWDEEPERVWVSVTDREHPRGILTYQWAGFEPYETIRSREE
jgi:GNAT superfamily N-acetyltransferase